jgi:hypothetical protein
MTAALSTASDYNTNNIHLIQQQEEGELHNSISNSREQDSFRMLVFHLSERITEITDILRSTQCAIADLRKQIAILDNKIEKLNLEVWRRNEQ